MIFDKKELPDLDEVVVQAMELFAREKLPVLKLPKFRRPLVVGSGNALVTGKILFNDSDAVFADEGNYRNKLENVKGIDGAVLISASGGKHAPIIARDLRRRKLKCVLLTNNDDAPAKEFTEEVFIFPKNVEPYTYNVSTYLGMIIAKTRENPRKVLHLLREAKKKMSRSFGNYDSYYILVPEKFHLARDMFLTKFDELFGSKIFARAFTIEQSKHAKTIVPSKKEMFVYLGVRGEVFGKHKDHFHVGFSGGLDYGGFISLGYYIIGHIQRQNKPWFKDNIENYAKFSSKSFGQKIEVIVR